MFKQIFSSIVILITFIAFSPSSFAQNTKTNGNSDEQVNSIYIDNNYFDDSLPATYERCQDTVHMENYLKSLGTNDGAKLKRFNAFLIGCQALLQDRIAKTKEQIRSIEEQKAK